MYLKAATNSRGQSRRMCSIAPRNCMCVNEPRITATELALTTFDNAGPTISKTTAWANRRAMRR